MKKGNIKKHRLWRMILALSFILVLIVTGCGAAGGGENSSFSGGKQEEKSLLTEGGSILPEQVLIKDKSGRNEYERSSNITALFQPRMFWGQWVLKGTALEDDDCSSGAKGRMEITRGPYTSKVESMPVYIQFGPLRSDDYHISNREAFNKSLSVDGYGYAEMLFNTDEDSDSDYDSPEVDTSDGIWCRSAFAVEEDRLGFGIMNQDPDEEVDPESQVSVKEVDYKFKWNGAELTLTKEGDSATYVPYEYEAYGNRLAFLRAYNLRNDERDDFIRLGLSQDDEVLRIGEFDSEEDTDPEEESEQEENLPQMSESTIIAEKYYEPKETVKMTYNSDGTGFTITSSDDRQYVYDTFYYSGKTLTLLTDGKISAYDCSSPGEATEQDNRFDYWPYPINLLQVGELWLNFFCEPFSDLILSISSDTISVNDLVDTDLDMKIDAGSVTDYFSLHYAGINYYVKAVNIYNRPAALKDCIPCCLYVDAESSDKSIVIDDRLRVGDAEYLLVKNSFDMPCIEIDSEKIVFSSKIEDTFETSYQNDHLDKDAIQLHTEGICNYIFSFKEGLLNSLRIEIPDLMINATENDEAPVTSEDHMNGDNLEEDESTENHDESNPSESSESMDFRKGLFDKLSKAFEEGSINVDIDKDTGIIILDNEILFDTGKYELKQEGEKYLDGVTEALVKTVTDEKVRNNIESIEIIGHTDQRGTYEYNLELSEKRADAVMKYILHNAEGALEGKDRESFTKMLKSTGKSFNDPVYDDDGQIDMDASRRVEIKFHLNVTN